MKLVEKIIVKITFILVFVILIPSCSSNDNSPDITQEDYYLTAKIDGVDFSADESSLVSFGADGTGFFNIKGISSNGDFIAITLISPTATGTFTMSTDFSSTAPRSNFSVPPGDNWSTHVLQITPQENQLLGFGSTTITTNSDTYMEGTFSFTGYNPLDNYSTKVISEGKFKAKKL